MNRTKLINRETFHFVGPIRPPTRVQLQSIIWWFCCCCSIHHACDWRRLVCQLNLPSQRCASVAVDTGHWQMHRKLAKSRGFFVVAKNGNCFHIFTFIYLSFWHVRINRSGCPIRRRLHSMRCNCSLAARKLSRTKFTIAIRIGRAGPSPNDDRILRRRTFYLLSCYSLVIFAHVVPAALSSCAWNRTICKWDTRHCARVIIASYVFVDRRVPGCPLSFSFLFLCVNMFVACNLM